MAIGQKEQHSNTQKKQNKMLRIPTDNQNYKFYKFVFPQTSKIHITKKLSSISTNQNYKNYNFGFRPKKQGPNMQTKKYDKSILSPLNQNYKNYNFGQLTPKQFVNRILRTIIRIAKC